MGSSLRKSAGIIYVVGVAPGSPAATAGFEFGDVISRVGSESSRTLPLWHLQNVLAGEAGAEIEFEILRRGKPEEFTLRLDDYPAPTPDIALAEGVPLLRIPRLEQGTALAVRSYLKKLASEEESKLLVDLRGTGATGDTEVAFELGRLLAKGEIGRLMRRGEVVETYEGSSEPIWTGKLVVLIDQGTIGSAEVLAGLLRDAAGAELVGERSFGYAGRQALATLSGGSGLFYTDAFYATPEGAELNEGLTPDVSVARNPFGFGEEPDDDEEEESDPILKRALEVVRGEVEPEELPKAA